MILHRVAGLAIIVGAGAIVLGCERTAGACVLVLLVCAIARGR